MTRKRLSTPSRVLRRKNRVATQLCRRLPIRHAHPHTCDMRRDDNGCGDPSPPTGPLPFRSALRSPFTSSARTAVSLSAVPFAVPSKTLLFSISGLRLTLYHILQFLSRYGNVFSMFPDGVPLYASKGRPTKSAIVPTSVLAWWMVSSSAKIRTRGSVPENRRMTQAFSKYTLQPSI